MIRDSNFIQGNVMSLYSKLQFSICSSQSANNRWQGLTGLLDFSAGNFLYFESTALMLSPMKFDYLQSSALNY